MVTLDNISLTSLLRIITIGSVTIRSEVTDPLTADSTYAAGGRSARGKTLDIMTVSVILGSVLVTLFLNCLGLCGSTFERHML